MRIIKTLLDCNLNTLIIWGRENAISDQFRSLLSRFHTFDNHFFDNLKKEMLIMENIVLFLDGSRGQFIPRDFAQTIETKYILEYEKFKYDLDFLAKDNASESDWYWNAWQNILDNIQIKVNGRIYSLYQCDDLFLVDWENLSENERQNLEY
jgi:hypothetical protein